MSGTLIEVKNLRRVFDVSKPWLNRVIEGGHLEFLKAVDGVSFAVADDEILAVIGPNGAGKTTIFNVVSRIYRPDRGSMPPVEKEQRTGEPEETPANTGRK